ncbi:MAG: hypothetical protein ABSG68_03130 [Thermoguttaceae bacterium]|jgi:hypothetical protein
MKLISCLLLAVAGLAIMAWTYFSSVLSGRMARAGRDEVLAGYQATAKERLAIAGHDFTVVGVLRRDVALLADCYEATEVILMRG